MARIVQKFGGSSVANAERIFRVAKIITDAYAKGNEMCVVLSAQGDTTDDLIARPRKLTPTPPSARWICCWPAASRCRLR